MTTTGGPDFVVGMAIEQRRTGPAIGDTAEANVGHAVPASNVRDGEGTSRAVCGTMTTVDDPSRKYWPKGGLAYMDCRTCAQRVPRAR